MPAPISRRELIRRLRHVGFSGPISGGRHHFMKKGALKVRIPNPHRRGDISGALLSEILRQAGITGEAWGSA
jgi:predicted RNA binding protein YcfA (HicA-like mRNA interferase family)